jgi:hypothetical protein
MALARNPGLLPVAVPFYIASGPDVLEAVQWNAEMLVQLLLSFTTHEPVFAAFRTYIDHLADDHLIPEGMPQIARWLRNLSPDVLLYLLVQSGHPENYEATMRRMQ